jgi:Membrane iron-sulfur containing protein FtrD-like
MNGVKEMAKKRASHQSKAAPAKKTNGNRSLLIAGAVAVVVVAGIWAISASGAKSSGGAGAVPAEEQKYIGRLLPASYVEPKVADPQVYATTVRMTSLTGAASGAGISIPADQLVADKIVYFEYQKPGADAIPLVAYIKPSGKLFVGVSYCPPCKGKGQRIEAGGTLVCETCGTVRTLESGVGVSGACRLYPLDELPASLSNGKITVETAAIDKWTPQPLDRPTGS